MHHRVVSALRQLRGDLAGPLTPALIEYACELCDFSWRRRLDPVATIEVFLLQVLNGNTAINHLSRLYGRSFTDSIYDQARSRLPLAVVLALLADVATASAPAMQQAAPNCYGRLTPITPRTMGSPSWGC